MSNSNTDWFDRENARDNIKSTRHLIYKGTVLTDEQYDQYHEDLKMITDYDNE